MVIIILRKTKINIFSNKKDLFVNSATIKIEINLI